MVGRDECLLCNNRSKAKKQEAERLPVFLKCRVFANDYGGKFDE